MNESFYKICGTPEQLQPIMRRLQVKLPNAYFDPMIKRGLKSDTAYFFVKSENCIIVPAGLVQFLKPFGIEVTQVPDFTKEEILEYIDNLSLPFKPYDFQIDMIVDSLIYKQQLSLACTGSGKSVVISSIANFLFKKGLKGLILVPNISLIHQLKNDIKDYNFEDLYKNTHLIGGDNKEKHLNLPLTIGTWQSVMKIIDKAELLDYIIVDEAHGLKLDNKSTDIVYKAINAQYRLGLTGTLPEDPVAKMSILSCVGAPKRYIKTQGLIERGLATPVHINILHLKYKNEDKAIFKYIGNYTKKLQFIKEHENRNLLISKLSTKVADDGNTVVMCSHIQHMKDLFTTIMKIKYPDVKLENKNISGAKAFDFQNEYGIYYIAGSTKAKDREKILDILKNNNNQIIITNYNLFSTGINIKSLKNIIFASPLKSYTTITQSIGRAIRLYVSKNTAEIYDFVDDFSVRGNSGAFYKQYINRLNLSYIPEGFPITERNIHI